MKYNIFAKPLIGYGPADLDSEAYLKTASFEQKTVNLINLYTCFLHK